jgi:cytochrome c oxidase assembly protein subunit 11
VFYNVINLSEESLTGVATYNVTPPKAGLYFTKIQCFCFEQQKIGAKEQVDLPVFFMIDPEIYNDPDLKSIENITLAYTFFNIQK